MKRLFVAIVCVAIISFLAFSLVGYRKQEYRDELVVAGRYSRPWELLSVHASSPRYLSIFGETFSGIRGIAPFYLRLPSGNGILFIAEKGKGEVYAYLADTGKRSIAIVNLGNSIFGGNIGAPRPLGAAYTDWIGLQHDRQIELLTRADDVVVRTVVDFDTGRVLERDSQKASDTAAPKH